MRYTAHLFDKTKPMPRWIRHYVGRRKAYWQRLWHAQPKYADKKAIRRVYKNAKRMRDNGLDVTVHHVIPLNGDNVCGLHVHTNLAIIDRRLNDQLGNTVWPGNPIQQQDLFGAITHEYPTRFKTYA